MARRVVLPRSLADGWSDDGWSGAGGRDGDDALGRMFEALVRCALAARCYCAL